VKTLKCFSNIQLVTSKKKSNIFFILFILGLSFVSGKIILPAGAPTDLKDSCLNVRIQEDRVCSGALPCVPNIIESFVKKGVKLEKPGVISYKMPFDGKEGVSYVVLATLNVGWCKNDGEWIRPGDYNSVTSSQFTGPKAGSSMEVDVDLEGYKTDVKPTLGELNTYEKNYKVLLNYNTFLWCSVLNLMKFDLL